MDNFNQDALNTSPDYTNSGEANAETAKPKALTSNGNTTVIQRQNGELRKSHIWVEGNNFYQPSKSKKGRRKAPPEAHSLDDRPISEDATLIIGFDTEFKTPSHAMSRDELKQGLAKYRVLSYQVHCKLFDPEQPDSKEWNGICYPDEGKRMTLPDLITFAVWKGLQEKACSRISCETPHTAACRDFRFRLWKICLMGGGRFIRPLSKPMLSVRSSGPCAPRAMLHPIRNSPSRSPSLAASHRQQISRSICRERC